MNPIRLEERFKYCSIDSFWFSHFAMTHPRDKDRINDYYCNSINITSEKVVMYCEMWNKYREN